jgi:hypothetical protein
MHTERRCHEHHLRPVQADLPLDFSRASVGPFLPPSPPGPSELHQGLTVTSSPTSRLTLHAVNKHNATLPQCFPEFKVPAAAK